jgi:hypothetical protein
VSKANGTVAPTKSPEDLLRDEYAYDPAPQDDLAVLGGSVQMNFPAAPAGPVVDGNGRARAADGTFLPADALPDTLTGSSHPANLVTVATSLGVEGIESLSTPELREAIRDAKLDRALAFQQAQERSAVLDASGRTTSQPGTPGGTAPADASNAQPAAAQQVALDWGTNEAGQALKEEDWPTPARNAFKLAAQVPDLLKRLDALEKGHGEVAQFVRTQASERFDNAVDQGFADAGPQFAAIVGKGAGMKMAKTDPAFEMRLDVIASLKRNPIKGLSPEKAIAQRTREKYAHLVAAEEGAEPAAPVIAPGARGPSVAGARPVVVHANNRIPEKLWQGGNTAAPTTRRQPAIPKGPAAAVSAVNDYLKSHSMGSETDPEMPE